MPGFSFSQLDSGQVQAATLNYEELGGPIDRAFTFYGYDYGDVPEPASYALATIGLAVVGWRYRRIGRGE